MLLPGIYQLLVSSPAVAVQNALANPAKTAIFIDVAVKQPPRPFLILTTVAAPPASGSLDGVTDLIDGELQFDSYADTPQAARKLSRAVRDFFMKTFVGGALSDGTTIQFTDVLMEQSEAYELGGVGYIYRYLLRLKAFYTEAP